MSVIFEDLYKSAIGKAIKISPTIKGMTLGSDATSNEFECDTITDIANEAVTSTPKKQTPLQRLRRPKKLHVVEIKSDYGLVQSKIKAEMNRANLTDREKIARKLEENMKENEKINAYKLSKVVSDFKRSKDEIILKEKALYDMELSATRAAEEKTTLANSGVRSGIEAKSGRSINNSQAMDKRKLCEAVINWQKAYRAEYTNIMYSRDTCCNKGKLDVILGQLLQKSLSIGFEELANKAKKGVLVQQDIKLAEQNVKNLREVHVLALKEISRINKETKEKEHREQVKKEAEAREKAIMIEEARRREEALAEEVRNKENERIKNETSIERGGNLQGAAKALEEGNEFDLVAAVLSDCFDRQSFQRFSKLRQKLEEVETSLEAFIIDPQLKALRFPLQKAVTMPVNAISSVSPQHIRDKYTRLHNLLSGKAVDCGGAKVNASLHPLGITFAKNLLAKSFVSQGYKALSGKSDTVFAVASVLVNLWVDFPDFGELVLAHFHKKCPYLAPVFLPRQEGQSDLEYYESQGYEITQNEVEKQDSFLNRMQGIMRLYSAVLVSKPRGGRPHPLGLPEAWRWLAAMLNLPPRPYICPALIMEFLKVAGHDMLAAYKGQFKKVLVYICKEYFPILERLTDNNYGGPMARLELFLQKVVKEEKIAAHPDVLSPNFW